MVTKKEWDNICDMIHRAAHEYEDDKLETENTSGVHGKYIIMPSWKNSNSTK